ncbi:MAG: HAMP domain-containing histidine kinase [Eubacteriaceae bacterium]|nr:HAMP domain-containing histidine kinase [Eubacteriaceae bacterium]
MKNNFGSSSGYKLIITILTVLVSTAAMVCIFGVIVMYDFNGYTGEIIIDPSRGELFNAFIEGIYKVKYLIIVFGAAGLALSFLGMYLLACAAGKKPGEGEITDNFSTKLPAEIYFTAMGFIIFYAAAGGIALLFEDIPVYADGIIGILLLLTAQVLFIAAFMNLAHRLKINGWWKNSLTYYALSFLSKCAKKLVEAAIRISEMLPITWKTALAVIGVLTAQMILSLMASSGNSPGIILIALAMDVFVLLYCCRMAESFRHLRLTAGKIAAGNMGAKVELKDLKGEMKVMGEALNYLGVGLNNALEQKMKSEHLRTELITNVSHDIKTPLTSIINYTDLLQKEGLTGRAAEYTEVLVRQSNRLKKLIDDLIEASKASTGNISVSLEVTNINELINQATAEYSEKLEASGLKYVVNCSEENLPVLTDGRLMWRVFDNLLSNACKYSQPNTRLYIDAVPSAKTITVSFKNVSREELNIPADELMERFVRADSSRTDGGSGLGLNIAKSLCELMGCGFRIEIDGDLFKAVVEIPVYVGEMPLSPSVDK